jgi:hypothetical protein
MPVGYRTIGASAACAALLFIAWPVEAALFTVAVETVAAVSPGSGFLDITLRNDSSVAHPLSEFALALKFAGDPGVTLDLVTRDPAAGYVFGADGLEPPFYEDVVLPPSEFVFSDGSFNPPIGFVMIGPSSDPANIVRLARIHFTVEAGASLGLRSITVDPSSSFSDDEALVPFIVNDDGGIAVLSQNAAVVPEPGTLSIFLIAGSLLVSTSRHRRHRATRKMD